MISDWIYKWFVSDARQSIEDACSHVKHEAFVHFSDKVHDVAEMQCVAFDVMHYAGKFKALLCIKYKMDELPSDSISRYLGKRPYIKQASDPKIFDEFNGAHA